MRMTDARECSIEWCDRPHEARGWCSRHYQRNRQGVDMDKPFQARMDRGGKCLAQGCDRPCHSRGFCSTHYDRVWRTGDPGGSIQTKTPGEWGPWAANGGGYVSRVSTLDGVKLRQYQHRHYMELHLGRPLVKGENVHHINGDRSDNRIENLELWSTSQPSGQRVADKVAWAEELLRQYKPEVLIDRH